jgi:hypothetical protein
MQGREPNVALPCCIALQKSALQSVQGQEAELRSGGCVGRCTIFGDTGCNETRGVGG